MPFKLSISIIIIFLSLHCFGQQGNLLIHIDGIRNTKGNVLMSIYNQKEKFMADPKTKAFYNAVGKIENREATFVIKNVPFGQYAITLLHDENKNDKMDKNLLGIPKEGYGFSNNVTLKFGPPSYEESTFDLNKKEQKIQITMKYFSF